MGVSVVLLECVQCVETGSQFFAGQIELFFSD